MDAAELMRFTLRWGTIGGILLSVYLVISWQTGMFGLIRAGAETGRAVTTGSLLTGIGSILMYMVLLVVADRQDLATSPVRFPLLLSYNYTVYVFWLLFDTFVIDILLVSVWRPGGLRLPPRKSHGSIRYHLSTIPRGLVLGVPVVSVATTVAWFMLR